MLLTMLIVGRFLYAKRSTIRRPRYAVAVAIIALTVSFGDRRPTVCAQDPFRSDFLFDRSSAAEGDRSIKKNRTEQHLREGTRIPPKVGQIVMLGRRWAFVAAPLGDDDSDDVVQLQLQRSVLSQPAPATLVSKDAIFDRERNAEIPHIILTENLMLQRIVEAIRADATDDRWMISGDVTEFFHENRLTIRTAQRANAN